MNACAQAAERFRADVTAPVGQIEAGLALGAEPAVTVAPHVQSAVYASLLPRLDMMKSMGLVWIPGRKRFRRHRGGRDPRAGATRFVSGSPKKAYPRRCARRWGCAGREEVFALTRSPDSVS
jgi:putative ABC transport system permease protein